MMESSSSPGVTTNPPPPEMNPPPESAPPASGMAASVGPTPSSSSSSSFPSSSSGTSGVAAGPDLLGNGGGAGGGATASGLDSVRTPHPPDDDDTDDLTNLNPGSSFDAVTTLDVPVLSAGMEGGAAAAAADGTGDGSQTAKGGGGGAAGDDAGTGGTAQAGAAYHPTYMFCGECTGCAAPPPPTTFANLRQRKKRRGVAGPPPSQGGGGVDLELAEMTNTDVSDDDTGTEGYDQHHLESPEFANEPSSTLKEGPPTTSHRSILRIANLTSPAQILVINSILEPTPGVTRLITTLSSQTVLIDHDPLIVPAQTLAKSLRDMGYDAAIVRDGGVDLATSSDPHGVCRSTLEVAGICCASEVPAVTSILRGLGRGVVKVLVNITTRTVYVDHDPYVVNADMLCRALNRERFGARVRRDGGRNTTNLPSRPGGGGGGGGGGGSTRFGGASGGKWGGTTGDGGEVPPLTVGTKGRSAFLVKPRHRSRPTLSTADVRPIQSVLSSVPAVTKIGINVTDGVLYVDHDTAITNVEDIAGALTAARYVPTVKVDAGKELAKLREGRRMQQQQQQQLGGPPGGGGGGAAEPGQNHQRQPAKSRYVESTLILPSLTTLDSVRRLERAMRSAYPSGSKDRGGVRAFYPHVPSRTVKVEHDPELVAAPDVADVLRSALGGGGGFDDVRVDVDGAVENMALPELDYGGPYSDYGDTYGDRTGGGGMTTMDGGGTGGGAVWALGGLHVSVVLSGICWFVSMLSVVDGWEYLRYAGIASVFLGMPSVTMKAWRTIRRWQFDANCMMVVAAFGALCLGEFDEAASVAFLFAVSEWLEARATARARRALGAIVSLRPDHANLINRSTGEITIVPASSIPVGSHVSVRTGDKIPADGIVEEGTSTIDESSLTGEARPVTKRLDDAVSGGSINVGHTRLVVRTTSTVDDSAVSRLIRLVEEAQANRSPTEKLVDSFAKRYTPVVVVAAALMCTVPWFFGSEVGRYWTLNGLIIIVIACPCALTISTPVTYAAGLAATAQRGIIVKGGARLEALGNVSKVVFDKTGTITEGKFTLIHLESIGEARTRRQLLELLALMEAPSSHPLSATLVNAAKKEGVDTSADVNLTDHTILKGEGVTARVDNQNVYVGNCRLFERLGLYNSLDASHKRSADSWSKAGGTVGFVGIQGEGIIGMFCVSDRVREEAKSVVASLQHDGFDVMMLTGDSDGAAKAVGREVGLPVECIHSHLMPEDKLHFIGSIRGMGGSKQPIMCGSKELVLMCGDGVNDAPALAVADVGVAMGEGAALAMEMSDVTLMDSNLTKLMFSIKMGSRVINTIRENIMLSLVAKIVVVALTFAGKMTLLWAIASDVGIMLAVTLNGMKLLPGRTGVSLKSERLAPVNKGRRGRYDEVLQSERQRNDLPDII